MLVYKLIAMSATEFSSLMQQLVCRVIRVYTRRFFSPYWVLLSYLDGRVVTYCAAWLLWSGHPEVTTGKLSRITFSFSFHEYHLSP